jgi:protein-arginine kinase
VQPAHLQVQAGRTLGPDELREMRASVVRRMLE